MPEEANRRLTDHLSQLLLAHSEGAVANLTRESIDPSRIHLVGNTMIDSVLRYLPHALAREAWSRFGVEPGDFALVTLHRPPLLMTPIYFAKPWKRSASSRASCRSFSPCTHELKLALASAGWRANKGRSDRLIPCPPLGYLDFLALEAKAAFVLTDSGGVQEETSALGVRCFTYRDTMERPVTVERGTNTVLGVDPNSIREIPAMLEAEVRSPGEIPLWDGRAGIRAAEVVIRFFGSDRAALSQRAQGSNRPDAGVRAG
jgi:UDP-N-acetylglucosamine 2-epimerase (non-hydrolysing)